MGLALVLAFVGNHRVSLWDRDEPRYAETARVMYQTGDWIVPYFNGEFRFQKPVLTYWAVALAYALFGDNVFAARLPSGIAVAAAALVVWLLGNRMFSRPAGLVSALFFLLCPVTVFLAKLCIPDGLQLLFGCVCFACLWTVLDETAAEGKRQTAAFCFWIFLGLAILAKGPIIPGMVATTLICYCLLTKVRPWKIGLRWRVGMVVLAAVTLPWFAAIYLTAGSEFYAEALGRQVGGRLAESFDGKLLPPGYYAATAILGFAPWITLTVHAWIRWKDRWLAPGPVAYLVSWMIGPMLLLEMFRSKQIHYYAPAYPAFALLAGGYLAKVLAHQQAWVAGRHAKILHALWFGMNLLISGSLAAVGWFGPPQGKWICLTLAAVSCAAVVVSYIRISHGGIWPAIRVQAIALAAVWIAVGAFLLPRYESARVLPEISSVLAEENKKYGAKPLLHQVIEPSLVYYSRMQLPILFQDEDFIRKLNFTSNPTMSLLTDDSLCRLEPNLAGRVRIVHSWRGWVKMHPDTVHLVLIEPPSFE